MNRAGAEMVVMNLYKAIDRTKFQFDFLYFGPDKGDFDEEIESLGGKIYRIVEKDPIRRMRVTIELLKQNPQWQIVHAHTLFSNGFHIYAAYKAGVKQRISHSHSTNDNLNNRLIRFFYHSISRKVQARYATDFAACGIEAAQYLFPSRDDIIFIPNSVDTKIFIDLKKTQKDYLRKEFDLPKDEIVILQLGRLEFPKNHMFSIQIAKALKNKDIKFKLFFAGQGSLLNQLKEVVANLNLNNEIVFLGLRTDIPYILAGSDVMLMPSIYEGLGVALIEAQATGTPSLISSDIPKEADLKMGLIYSYSLEKSPKKWGEKLIEIHNKDIWISKEKRLSVLKGKGYDSTSKIKTIEKLYSQE